MPPPPSNENRRLFGVSRLLVLCVTLAGGAGILMPATDANEGDQVAPAVGPPAASPTPAQVSPDVQRAVDAAIKDRLKDSKVVDVETSEAIASRMVSWAKLFGFFVGVPLTILAFTLGFLGVRTYNDFSKQIGTARDDALKQLEESTKEAKRIGEGFTALKAKLEEINALATQVQELSQKVARIESVVQFKASPALTPALKDDLDETLKEYYTFLKGVGLAVALRPPTVVIDPKDVNAYYMPGKKNQIVIHPELAPYPDVALREFTHHVLAALQPKWQRIAANPTSALESGLADYLPSSFLDRSDFGRDIWPIFERHIPGMPIESRDLNNQRHFSDLKKPDIEFHSLGTVWGGAFWELRGSIGRQTIDRLLLQAWHAVDLAELPDDPRVFPRELIRQSDDLDDGKHSARIREVFRRRGLEV